MTLPKVESSIDIKGNLYLRKLSPALVKFIENNFPQANWEFESIVGGYCWDIRKDNYLIQIIHREYHGIKRVALWKDKGLKQKMIWRFDQKEFDDPSFIRKLKLLSFW